MAFPGLGQFSAPGYPNNYIPGYAGDGENQKRFIIGYTLDEASWATGNYLTVLGADKPRAFYPRYLSEDFARVPHATGLDMVWANGAERPKAGEDPRFTNEEYKLERYGKTGFVGDQTEEYSEIGSQVTLLQETYAGQARIFRTIMTQTEMTTSANYASGNYYADWGDLANDAVTQGYAAGYFGVAGTDTITSGTVNDPLIYKFFDHAVRKILLKSNGRIQSKDLIAVMNPTTAARLAKTQEIRVFNAQQSGSINYTQGKAPYEYWPTMGLPNPLYGLKILVDPTVKVAAKQDHVNAGTQAFAIPDGQITILARPGSITGVNGSVPFSSLVLWQHKKDAMKPMTEVDPFNKRIKVGFEDMFVVKLVGGDISFNITDVFTATV